MLCMTADAKLNVCMGIHAPHRQGGTKCLGAVRLAAYMGAVLSGLLPGMTCSTPWQLQRPASSLVTILVTCTTCHCAKPSLLVCSIFKELLSSHAHVSGSCRVLLCAAQHLYMSCCTDVANFGNVSSLLDRQVLLQTLYFRLRSVHLTQTGPHSSFDLFFCCANSSRVRAPIFLFGGEVQFFFLCRTKLACQGRGRGHWRGWQSWGGR